MLSPPERNLKGIKVSVLSNNDSHRKNRKLKLKKKSRNKRKTPTKKKHKKKLSIQKKLAVSKLNLTLSKALTRHQRKLKQNKS